MKEEKEAYMGKEESNINKIKRCHDDYREYKNHSSSSLCALHGAEYLTIFLPWPLTTILRTKPRKPFTPTP